MPDLTPRTSVASLDMDTVTELMLASMDRCFELKLFTVARLDSSPDAATDCPLAVEFGCW
jgi:hypothetical protein